MSKMLLGDSDLCAPGAQTEGRRKWGAPSAAAWNELFSSLVIQCCSWLQWSISKTFLS